MGSENLNRVFIKAYGKGSANNATGGEASVANQEIFVMRFDTATVEIPAPHMLAPPRQPSRQVQQKAPAPQPVHAEASTTAPVETNLAQEPEVTPWDETMMSILFGGSTMVAPSTTIQSTRRQSLRSQHASADSASDKTPNSGRESVVPNKSETGLPSSQQTTSKTVDRPVAAESKTALPPFEDDARQVPNSESLSELKADLNKRIAALNQGGEIFRLDRPSYEESSSTTNKVMAQDQFDEDDTSHTALDIDLQQAMQATPAPKAKPADRPMQVSPSAPHSDSIGSSYTMEKTKRREQGLRQARIKIFNPLWEVDRLEWPAICNELSRTIDEGSSAVVNNLQRATQAGLQVLAVTSPQSGEGTSTVACCLAMLAGKHGMNIALVDGNIENPSLSYQTNLDLEVDWNDAVSRRMPLEEIAVHSVDDQVTLVPLLDRLNAPELNEQNVAIMLQELSQSFDLVIVDLGHMAAQRNLVRKLGELGVINAVVAVVDRRLSSPERIESCLRQIRQTGISSIGLVENFAA